MFRRRRFSFTRRFATAASCGERDQFFMLVFLLLLSRCYSILAFLDRKATFRGDLDRNYTLEDFFWSGSGDGENDTDYFVESSFAGHQHHSESTVFHTTTIYSTSTISRNHTISIQESNSGMEYKNCTIIPTAATTSASSLPSTKTEPPIIASSPPLLTIYEDVIPDQRFWLVTILNTNETLENVYVEFQNRLATLYQKAFNRQQENHLGLHENWNKAKSRVESRRRNRKKRHLDDVFVRIHNVTSNGSLTIVYSVRIQGRAVLATIAADDMKFISESEAVAELGYAVIVKAEPYLRNTVQTERERQQISSSLFVTTLCSIAAFIFLLLSLSIICKKIRKKRETKKLKRKKSSAMSFVTADDENATGKHDGPNDLVIEDVDEGNVSNNRRIEDDANCSKPNSAGSVLSMPSVKDFPKTQYPETLSNVLNVSAKKLSHDNRRSSSLGDEDPGVIGPIVWNMRGMRTKSDIPGSFPANPEGDLNRMKKRWDQILDDTFRTCESYRYEGKEENICANKWESSQSSSSRQTAKRFSSALSPKMNWKELPPSRREFPSNFSYIRPASVSMRTEAKIRRPIIHPELILTDAELTETDPAVPVISAIKSELNKFYIP